MGSEHDKEVDVGRVAQAPHRVHVPLLVQGQAVVHGTVKMDGQLREGSIGPVAVRCSVPLAAPRRMSTVIFFDVYGNGRAGGVVDRKNIL